MMRYRKEKKLLEKLKSLDLSSKEDKDIIVKHCYKEILLDDLLFDAKIFLFGISNLIFILGVKTLLSQYTQNNILILLLLISLILVSVKTYPLLSRYRKTTTRSKILHLVNFIEQLDSFSVSVSEPDLSECCRCLNFHGVCYEHDYLVCAIHPHGTKNCPDFHPQVRENRLFFPAKPFC